MDEEQLVVDKAHLVTKATNALHGAVKSRMEWEDLYQSGMIGLLKAARKYNPTLGVPLDAWLYPRIRHAIIDSIRRALGRTPRDREFRAKIMPLFDWYDEIDEDYTPDESLYRQQLFRIIEAEVKNLTPREERVLSECFFHELPKQAVADEEDVCIATVSHARAAMLQRFRLAIEREEDERARLPVDLLGGRV